MYSYSVYLCFLYTDIDDDVPTASGAAKRCNSKKTEQKSKTCIPETFLVLSDDEEGDEVTALNK